MNDAVLNYQAVRGIGGYDFGTVGGFLDFLDSQPLGWSAGRQSVWQALVDDVGLPADLRDEIREAERLRRRVVDLRYAATVETRLAAAAVLGDHVAGEYVGRGMLDDGAHILQGTRRLMGGPSDPRSGAEPGGVRRGVDPARVASRDPFRRGAGAPRIRARGRRAQHPSRRAPGGGGTPGARSIGSRIWHRR